jgi:hypothetical protein
MQELTGRERNIFSEWTITADDACYLKSCFGLDYFVSRSHGCYGTSGRSLKS